MLYFFEIIIHEDLSDMTFELIMNGTENTINILFAKSP